jgi:hypothetical protein
MKSYHISHLLARMQAGMPQNISKKNLPAKTENASLFS